MIVRKHPTFPDVAVLDPDILILFGKGNLHLSILHKDRGMGFAIQMHDLALVVLQILNAHR